MNKLFILLVIIVDCTFGFIRNSSRLTQTRSFLDASRMLLFYGSTYEDQQAYPLEFAEEILNDLRYDASKRTMLYIHGYDQTIDDENIRLIVNAYQQRDDYNILVIDWTNIANGNYFVDALPNTVAFAPIITDVLIRLFNRGLSIERLHVVTHSLGSHLAGMIGRRLQQVSKGQLKLRRITCLDPAFPGFYMPLPLFPHITKDDAEFVDAIHSDAVIYGTPFSTATVDFWPNGASIIQPGCPSRDFQFLRPRDLCSHWRSWRFWAESVANNSSRFMARKCGSFYGYTEGFCKNNHEVSMGISCPAGVTGNYYLRTRATSPYSY